MATLSARLQQFELDTRMKEAEIARLKAIISGDERRGSEQSDESLVDEHGEVSTRKTTEEETQGLPPSSDGRLEWPNLPDDSDTSQATPDMAPNTYDK